MNWVERKIIYDAFISYRHTDLDRAVAEKLQKKLERYVPPSFVRSDKPFKKLHIFRDETELPTSSNLSDNIINALDSSRFLIVLCSKTTKDSNWCMQEITYFKELHGGRTDNIITLITEGEPSEVFPPKLLTEERSVASEDGSVRTETVDVEPLAANVAASSIRESLKKLKREFLRIAAPLMGYGFDTLYNRNQKRFIKRVISISIAATVFLLAFGIYTSIMLFKIDEQKTDLQIQQSQYLSKESSELLEAGDRLGAINSAIAALPVEDKNRPWIPQAEYALSNAVYAYECGRVQIDRLLTHSSPVEQVLYSNDGSRIISSDTQNNLYIFNSSTGERIGYFPANNGYDFITYAINDKNLLFVANRLSFFCVDVNTSEVLWEKEHDTYHDRSFAVHDVVVSNDGNTVALVYWNTLVFVSTSDGEMLFSPKLIADSSGEYLGDNGAFSIDDEAFYIDVSGAYDPYSSLSDDKSVVEKIFRINMETRDVRERKFDTGIRVLEIFVDYSMEIFAVNNYGDEGRAVVLAFSRKTQEPIWEGVISTNAGYLPGVFIHRYNSSVFVACGSSVFVVNANNGEELISETLSTSVLQFMPLREHPDRIITVLTTGEIYISMLKEVYDPLSDLFIFMSQYFDNLTAVSFIYYPSNDNRGISKSMKYAFVTENQNRNFGLP